MRKENHQMKNICSKFHALTHDSVAAILNLLASHAQSQFLKQNDIIQNHGEISYNFLKQNDRFGYTISAMMHRIAESSFLCTSLKYLKIFFFNENICTTCSKDKLVIRQFSS